LRAELDRLKHQSPAAEFNADGYFVEIYANSLKPGDKLYLAAGAQKPLTDDQIMKIGRELGMKCRLGGNQNIDFDYARAIEAAHKIG
jgi:hypothetical protein